MDSPTLLTEREMSSWRTTLIRRMMRAVVWCGIPIVLIASFYEFMDAAYWRIPIYVGLLGVISVIAFWNRVSDTVRMVSMMALMYALVLLDYFSVGQGSLTPVFLLAIAFFGALFFGLRGVIIAMIVDLLTVAGFVYLQVSSPGSNVPLDFKLLAGWISNSTVVILLGAFLSLFLNDVIQRMADSIKQGNLLNRELARERSSLEIKVLERTTELRAANEQITGLVNTLSKVSEHIESGDFDPRYLAFMVNRPDAFGQLARVFQAMGYEVSAREKRLRMLRVIIPAGVALIAEKDFNRLLETIVIEAQKLCNADGGSVYLVRGNELEFLVARNSKLNLAVGGTTGIKPHFPPVAMYDTAGKPNLQSATVRATLCGDRLMINDVYSAETPEDVDLSMTKNFDAENNYHTQSLLVLPIADGTGKVLGALQLINARDEKGELTPFRPDDVLESLVLFGATALTNYWREEQLRAEIAQLRIEIDQTQKLRQVSEVTETDYFRDLTVKAKELRHARKPKSE